MATLYHDERFGKFTNDACQALLGVEGINEVFVLENGLRIDYTEGQPNLKANALAAIAPVRQQYVDWIAAEAAKLQTAKDAWADLVIFHNATPDQAETYIENQVTDLASAKNVLKLLAKAVIALVYFTRLDYEEEEVIA
jgi:hypothetical protein